MWIFRNAMPTLMTAAFCTVATACGAPDRESVPDEDAENTGTALSALSVSQGTMAHATSFSKAAGWRYTVCVTATSGNPDLFGNYTGWPTVGQYQFVSTNPPSTNQSDCFSFDSGSAGTYYVGVYGTTAATYNTPIIVGSNSAVVPANFYKALVWPTASCTSLTSGGNGPTSPNGAEPYGAFNSPVLRQLRFQLHELHPYRCRHRVPQGNSGLRFLRRCDSRQ